MNVLECSTRGCALGRRFSAFIAKVTYNGKYGSIEEHYQNAKRFDGMRLPKKQAKGKTPTDIIVYGKVFPTTSLTAFYYLLWYKFYKENTWLVLEASKYDEYNDMFKGKSVNCQADTLRLYINDKAKYLEIIKPLLIELGYKE